MCVCLPSPDPSQPCGNEGILLFWRWWCTAFVSCLRCGPGGLWPKGGRAQGGLTRSCSLSSAMARTGLLVLVPCFLLQCVGPCCRCFFGHRLLAAVRHSDFSSWQSITHNRPHKRDLCGSFLFQFFGSPRSVKYAFDA